jgi:hypothetical protein
MEWLRVFLILMLISASCRAQGLDSAADELSLGLSLYIPEGYNDVDLSFKVYIVRGARMDPSERLMSDMIVYSLKSSDAEIQVSSSKDLNVTVKKVEVVEVDDSQSTRQMLEKSRSFIVLFGGPLHNDITQEYYRLNYIANDSTKLWGTYTIAKGKTPSGSAIAAYTHKSADMGQQNNAAKYSPLSWIMPREYVAIAATGTGIILMALISLIKTVFEFKALDLGRYKLDEHKPIRLLGSEINEFLAVFGASLVLGLSITWVFFGFTADFARTLAENTAVSLIAAISHELAHRLAGWLFGIRMRYRFWLAGSAVTLLTGYLGNAFGVQGFLVEDVEIGTKRWKIGLSKLAAPATSAAIAIIASILNQTSPSHILQMTYITASLWAMGDILPFRSLDGYDIKQWSWMVWQVSFLTISAVFIYVNFLV